MGLYDDWRSSQPSTWHNDQQHQHQQGHEMHWKKKYYLKKKMKCKTKERRKKKLHTQTERLHTTHTLEWHGRENDDETISLIVQRQRQEITNMRLLVFFLARFISAHARKTNWKHFQFLTAMVILFNHSAVCTRTIVRCAAQFVVVVEILMLFCASYVNILHS